MPLMPLAWTGKIHKEVREVNVHVIVSVFQGVPAGVKVYLDKAMAERGLVIAREDLEIEEGEESESENSADLFYNVPVF